MSELHKALECLRPKDFSEIPTDNLKEFLPEILSNAELIANSVPPPPNGTPFESAQRTRTDPTPATSAADLTKSEVRRPPPAKEHEELQKSWGKPVKLSNKETATGMSVFKMAGHDRHGAWFARTSVHEGLGFAKWKRAMLKEFPESLEVQGGPGEGNVRGIGGDQRLEDITVDGIGKLEVYQLSAQFPGPTSPREFITLLLTSSTCLTEASKVGDTIPRHFMVVSIPVTHPDVPPRAGMVRGYYESIEMIREIPLPNSKEAGEDEAETNPIEWIMVTRSDPGGGIPRFMVERNVPSSIVQDALKFLDWACAKDEVAEGEEATSEEATEGLSPHHDVERTLSITQSNGIMAGIGTSIADRPSPALRRLSQQTVNKHANGQEGLMDQIKNSVGAYVPDAINPLKRTSSSSSTSTSSSVESFASAEQFNTTTDGLPIDDTIPTPSSTSQQSLPLAPDDSPHAREMKKIEDRKRQLTEQLEQAREKQSQDLQNENQRTQKEMEKAAEKHERERKKQEDKFQKEIRKLEERREKETKKLLARQQKEADKNQLLKAQRERDEYKQKATLFEQENKLLKEQIGELQRENTALVARMGKTENGREVLRLVRDEDMKGRTRASSRASGTSGRSAQKSKDSVDTSGLGRSGTETSMS
ncbi:Nn.00g026210.m01.CDS01 [Neocucurbitaria sp. VM-36]